MGELSSGYGEFCLQSETSDGSTVFRDSVNEGIISHSGNVYHSTNQANFGNSSIYVGGSSGDSLGELFDINKYTDFEIGADDLYEAIDFWVYPTKNNINIIESSDENIYLKLKSNNDIEISFFKYFFTGDGFYRYNNHIVNNTEHNLTLNQWNHIYISGMFSVYKDYSIPTTFITNSITKLGINGQIFHLPNQIVWGSDFNESLVSFDVIIKNSDAYYEEIRKSENYITSDFDLFTVPYPVSTYEVSGLVKEVLDTVERKVRIYKRSNGSFIKETMSNSDGTFKIDGLLDLEEYYVVCLDDDEGTEYNALIYDRIIPNISED